MIFKHFVLYQELYFFPLEESVEIIPALVENKILIFHGIFILILIKNNEIFVLFKF